MQPFPIYLGLKGAQYILVLSWSQIKAEDGKYFSFLSRDSIRPEYTYRERQASISFFVLSLILKRKLVYTVYNIESSSLRMCINAFAKQVMMSFVCPKDT